MASPSVTTAPRPQVMSSGRADAVDRAQSQYAIDMAEYDASPCRQTAGALGCLALTAGTLGCFVVVPVVSSQIAGYLSCGLSTGASACCCAASALGMKIANLPDEPRSQTHDSGYTGSGGGS